MTIVTPSNTKGQMVSCFSTGRRNFSPGQLLSEYRKQEKSQHLNCVFINLERLIHTDSLNVKKWLSMSGIIPRLRARREIVSLVVHFYSDSAFYLFRVCTWHNSSHLNRKSGRWSGLGYYGICVRHKTIYPVYNDLGFGYKVQVLSVRRRDQGQSKIQCVRFLVDVHVYSNRMRLLIVILPFLSTYNLCSTSITTFCINFTNQSLFVQEWDICSAFTAFCTLKGSWIVSH